MEAVQPPAPIHKPIACTPSQPFPIEGKGECKTLKRKGPYSRSACQRRWLSMKVEMKK
jgi:hypothetical protein